MPVQSAKPICEVEVVQVPSMAGMPWLLHGFSTRHGGVSTVYGGSGKAGDLNLGFTEADDRANVETNRRLFLQAVTGDPHFPLITVRQVHSPTVRVVTAGEAETRTNLEEADGLMTAEPGTLLGIQTADCIPVLVADRKRKAVAAFHAGWRGTVRRIVESGVVQMRSEFGSEPQDLIAAIGPGIGQCCYRVGEEVRNAFTSEFSYAADLFGEKAGEKALPSPGGGVSLHLDLVEANRRQLLDAGVAVSAIAVLNECTSCRRYRYFSYRAERRFTGRMLSVVGIRQG